MEVAGLYFLYYLNEFEKTVVEFARSNENPLDKRVSNFESTKNY